MRIADKSIAKKAFPTGKSKFSVMQAFPAALTTAQVDPMLMCDYFCFTAPEKYEKGYPINWHPHAGMDICTYLKQGVGRHADSLGNYCEFSSPGIQWISVGSGIEHAEGGGTPKGQIEEGFQLWFNTPTKYKSNDPVYGQPDTPLPIIHFTGVKATLIAGNFQDKVGPFKTVQPIQVLDFELDPSSLLEFEIPKDLEKSVLFVYSGSGRCMDSLVNKWDVLLLEEGLDKKLILSGGEEGLKAILFSGKPIGERVCWVGSFVQGSEEDMQQVVSDYWGGRFPKVRVDNYKSEFV